MFRDTTAPANSRRGWRAPCEQWPPFSPCYNFVTPTGAKFTSSARAALIKMWCPWSLIVLLGSEGKVAKPRSGRSRQNISSLSIHSDIPDHRNCLPTNFSALHLDLHTWWQLSAFPLTLSHLHLSCPLRMVGANIPVSSRKAGWHHFPYLLWGLGNRSRTGRSAKPVRGFPPLA